MYSEYGDEWINKIIRGVVSEFIKCPCVNLNYNRNKYLLGMIIDHRCPKCTFLTNMYSLNFDKVNSISKLLIEYDKYHKNNENNKPASALYLDIITQIININK